MKRIALASLVLLSVISACSGPSWPPKDLEASAHSAVEPVTTYPVIAANNYDTVAEVFTVGQGAPESILFTPDNNTLVGIGPSGIYVYENPDEPPQVLSGHDGRVTHIGFLPDGKTMISSGLDGTLVFWDTDDWSQTSTWEIGGFIDNFDVHPDGDKLVTARRTGTDGWGIAVETWDIDSREMILEIDTIKTDDPVRKITYNADGSQVALTYGFLLVYDANTGEQLARSTVNSVDIAFSPARDEFMYATRTGFAVYDTNNWEQLISSSDTQIFDDNRVVRMELLPDDEYALFLLDNGQFDFVRAPFVAETWHVTNIWKGVSKTIDIAVDSESQVATLSEDGVVRKWNYGFRREMATSPEPETTEIGGLLFSDDSTQLTAIGANGSIQTYDTQTFGLLNTVKQDTNWGTQIAFSHAGTRFVAQDLGTTSLYSLEDGEEVWSFEDELFIKQRDSFRHLDIEKSGNSTMTTATSYPNPLRAVFTPDDKYVVVSSFGGFIFYDAETGERKFGPIWVRNQDIDNLMHLAFTRDGRYMLGGTDESDNFVVWDYAKLLAGDSEKPEYKFKATRRVFMNSIISDDYKVASVAKSFSSSSTSFSVIAWDLLTKEELASVQISADMEREIKLAFSPDGSLIAAASDTGQVALVSLDGSGTGFEAHAGKIHAIAFSPDGTLLATAGEDGSLRLWAVSE